METAEVNLDGLDISKINDVFQAIREIDGLNSVRVNKVEFTIYGSEKVTITRRGKWCPLVIRKIRKLYQ